MTNRLTPTLPNGIVLCSVASSLVLTVWYVHSIRKKTNSSLTHTKPPKNKQNEKKKNEDGKCRSVDRYACSVELPTHLEREIRKEQRRKANVAFLARKTPMYDNVRMLDPGGEVLCTISAKKGRWYVEKDLAEWTDSSHTCIQLKFEPKGRSNRGENGCYVRASKQNICVACGDDRYHMRHYVVPYMYRSRFPQKYKSHLSHDIVILCPKCHLHCERECQRRTKRIDVLFRSGDEKSRTPFITDKQLCHVRSCALALLRWKHKVPESKVVEYERTVRNHLNIGEGQELTTDRLQMAIDVEYRISNPDYVSGAELVARFLAQDDAKIEQFVRDWRKHFVDTVYPRFLPEGWSVNSPVACDEC